MLPTRNVNSANYRAGRDSNPRPHGSKPRTLSAELPAQVLQRGLDEVRGSLYPFLQSCAYQRLPVVRLIVRWRKKPLFPICSRSRSPQDLHGTFKRGTQSISLEKILHYFTLTNEDNHLLIHCNQPLPFMEAPQPVNLTAHLLPLQGKPGCFLRSLTS